MKTWWLALLFAITLSACAQTDAASVTFHLERAGLEVPVYTFVVFDTGTGTYTAEGVPVSASTNKYSVKTVSGPQQTVQALSLNAPAANRLFELLRASHDLHGCESKAKGVAYTGTKVLTWRMADQQSVSCTFNFSEVKPVAELMNVFEAMAFTLDLARKMEGEQKFDRLGLDGEMTTLVAAVKDGRAMGLSNIRGTLQALVDDPAVLERVRVQAGKLIEQGMVTP